MLSLSWHFLFLPSASCLAAEPDSEPSDSLTKTLEEIVITSDRISPFTINYNGEVSIDPSLLNTQARVLGEADIVNALKNLPGISSSSDYGSGLIIDGAAPSQTLFMIEDAPVFFPYRFGGIFSTFNSAHFRKATFSRSMHPASIPQRLGGIVNMSGFDNVRKFGGQLNVGLLSSSATLKIPITKKLSFVASGRISYIDQLYHRIIKSERNEIFYSFHDLNATLSYRISETDNLSVNFFRNSDKVDFTDENYDLLTTISWANNVASARWNHKGGGPKSPEISVTAFYSGFSSRLNLDMPDFLIDCPSSIDMAGERSIFRHRTSGGKLTFDYGLNFNAYWANVQHADIRRGENTEIATGSRQRFVSGALFADVRYEFNDRFSLDAGYSNGLYSNGSYRRYLPGPRLTFSMRFGTDRIRLHAGLYHQYLHQTGLSDMGLASNFWSGATQDAPVEQAWNFSASWSKTIYDIGTPSVEVFFKKVSNQPEFSASILDFLDDTLDPLKEIDPCSGYNYGFNVSFNRNFGNLTGSLSYGFAEGRLRAPGESDYWRSQTSTGHTLVASAYYRFDEHWIAGASFRYASGRPYTPVKSIYVIASNIVMDYGVRNSGSLPDYQRLDLSGSYTFRTGGRLPLKHIVSLSLLNAYGHRNVEMQYYIINSDSKRYKLKRLESLYRFLPSLSYTMEF